MRLRRLVLGVLVCSLLLVLFVASPAPIGVPR
jgi:hypothetical protein